MIAFYHFFRQHSYTDKDLQAIDIFQLKEAAKNYLRKLKACFGREELRITFEEYTTACATTEEILQELKETERKLRRDGIDILSLEDAYLKSREETRNKERCLFVPILPEPLCPIKDKVSPDCKFSENSLLGKEATWNQLSHVLQQLDSIIDRLNSDKKIQNLLLQVESTLRNLSHLKNESTSLNAKDANALITTLVLIQNKYNQAIFQLDEMASPAVQNTGMEFLALAYELAVAADGPLGVLKNFDVYSEFFYDKARGDQLYTIQDPNLLKQRNELEQFFNRKSPKIFNFYDIHFDDQLSKSILRGQFQMETCIELISKKILKLVKHISNWRIQHQIYVTLV